MTDTAADRAGDRPAVKVGVLLDADPGSIGEWLADAGALDAAGVDALWVDLGAAPALDAVAMVAALAVTTPRSQIVLALDGVEAEAPGLARRLDTVRRLSHDRLTLVVDPDRAGELPSGLPVLRRQPGEPAAYEGRDAAGDPERWVSVPAPQGRAPWRETCAEAADQGAYGVVVPANPTLLDILRNPKDPGGRRDLRLAQG